MGENKINNKEEQNKNNNKNNKFICEVCGNKKRHERTIKHNEIKYIWTERFEVIR